MKLIVLLMAAIAPGLIVHGFWWALVFGVVLWQVNTVLKSATDEQ